MRSYKLVFYFYLHLTDADANVLSRLVDSYTTNKRVMI